MNVITKRFWTKGKRTILKRLSKKWLHLLQILQHWLSKKLLKKLNLLLKPVWYLKYKTASYLTNINLTQECTNITRSGLIKPYTKV